MSKSGLSCLMRQGWKKEDSTADLSCGMREKSQRGSQGWQRREQRRGKVENELRGVFHEVI